MTKGSQHIPRPVAVPRNWLVAAVGKGLSKHTVQCLLWCSLLGFSNDMRAKFSFLLGKRKNAEEDGCKGGQTSLELEGQVPFSQSYIQN